MICEKPLAASLAEVDRLTALAQTTGLHVSPIFQYRFGNGFRRLLHLRDAGLLGKTYLATVETHWRRGAAYYAVPWRGRFATELGGSLTSHAIHAHDMLMHALGPVRSVHARTATRVNPIETEDCAVVSLELADGGLAALSVTMGAALEHSRLRFYFERVTVESNLSPYRPHLEPWRFETADEAGRAEIEAALAGFTPAARALRGPVQPAACGAHRGRSAARHARGFASLDRAVDGFVLVGPLGRQRHPADRAGTSLVSRLAAKVGRA